MDRFLLPYLFLQIYKWIKLEKKQKHLKTRTT